MKYSIARSIGIISIFTILTAFCTFLFQLVIARVFGAGYETDTFFLAFSIPEWFINTIILIFPAALVPAFSSYLALKKEEKSWQLIYSFLTLFCLLFIVIYSIVLCFGLPIAELLGGNLPEDYRHDLSLHLLILIPFILFSCLSSLWTGYLYAHEKVIFTSLTPLIKSGIDLFLLFLLKQWLGIFAASVSISLGSLIQCVILSLVALRGRIKTRFVFFSRPLKETLKLMIPILLGNIIFKSNVIINRYLATFLTAGSVSAMYYASRIIRLSARATSTGFIRVFFPRLAQNAALKDKKRFSKNFSVSTQASLYFAFPIAAGLVLLAPNIIAILFRGDNFDANSVIASSIALIGLIGTYLVSPLSDLLANSFYAQKDTKTVIVVQLILFIPAILLKIVMVQKTGLIGLCAVSSFITLITSIILMLLIKRKTRHINLKPIIILTGKCFIATALLGIPLFIFGFPFASPFLTLSRWIQIPIVGGISIALFAGYVLIGKLLKIPFSEKLISRILKRKKGKSV
jgi:putative peptidoglycan lipid II flippase